MKCGKERVRSISKIDEELTNHHTINTIKVSEAGS